MTIHSYKLHIHRSINRKKQHSANSDAKNVTTAASPRRTKQVQVQIFSVPFKASRDQQRIDKLRNKVNG